MTREEAIRVLEFDLDHKHNIESKEALRMAIKALEQKPNENMPCITPEEMQKCKDIVKKYTPKQEPCDDAISRQNIIDTYESCADMLSDEELEGANLVMKWVYKAPSVRPQEQESVDKV